MVGEYSCMSEIPKPEFVDAKYRDIMIINMVKENGILLRNRIDFDHDHEPQDFYERLKVQGLTIAHDLAWVELDLYTQFTLRNPEEMTRDDPFFGSEVTHTLGSNGLIDVETQYVTGIKDYEYEFQTKEEILATKALTSHMAEWLTQLTTSTQEDADRDFGLDEFIQLLPDA